MNSVISSHKVKRTKNIFSLVLYSLYLLSVLSSLKCTVVSRGSSKSLSAETALLPQRLLRRSQKASAASTICTKKIIIFLISLLCTCLWHPEVLLGVVHPGGRPSSVELIPGQSDRGNGKESNMLGEFYQSQPQWLSSKDIKVGVTVVGAANEKPHLLLTALCRGCPCCLPTEPSPQGAHAGSTEGRLCVPSLNVEGPVSRCRHCAEPVGSLSGCVFEYRKIESLRQPPSKPCRVLTH